MNHFRLNVEDLWMGLFGKTLDVEKRVIHPMHAMEAEAGCPDVGTVMRLLDDLRPERE